MNAKDLQKSGNKFYVKEKFYGEGYCEKILFPLDYSSGGLLLMCY